MSEAVYLKTNLPEFANDLSEEIRLFLSDTVITTDEAMPHDICVCVLFSEENEWKCKSFVTQNGAVLCEYELVYEKVSGSSLVVKRHKKRCAKIAVFRAFLKLYPDAFVPWGSLTGIRPTKLLRELESEMEDAKAKQMMLCNFDVSEQKYDVAKQIVDIQKPIINSVRDNDLDVYIGIPYCKTRCLYCSFASDLRTNKTDMRPYIEALKTDIKMGAQLAHDYGYNIRSFYMGGGTPTVLTADELYEVLSCAKQSYQTFGREFTVEAGRPDTITKDKLAVLKEFGAGRISVNPQTMNEKTLELIGRSHTTDELCKVFYMARDMGFDINMDIITCLPGESLDDVMHTLSCIKEMKPENLTVHTLALKRSSRLKQVIGDENIASIMPDAQLADKMVESGLACAKELSMRPYYMYRQKYMRGNLENIGYALPGKECIYNVDMMEETVSIMAHGAGSMSKRIFSGRSLRVERIANPKDVATYIAKLGSIYEEKRNLFFR